MMPCTKTNALLEIGYLIPSIFMSISRCLPTLFCAFIPNKITCMSMCVIFCVLCSIRLPSLAPNQAMKK